MGTYIRIPTMITVEILVSGYKLHEIQTFAYLVCQEIV